MPRKKKTTAPAAVAEKKVEAAAVEAVKVEEAAPVVEAPKAEAPAEKKAPAKKAAAPKKTAEKKTAEKKAAAPAKKTEPKTAVYFQYAGIQVTTDELIKKAKKESGVKSPKQINIYVKPEDNKVYYVVDDNAGDFELVK